MGWSEQTRIGIVGAGAAGLSAALALKDRGFEQVTVLERGDRVGGQCRSIEHRGRAFDLGALFVTGAFERVSALCRRYGVDADTRTGGFVRLQHGEAAPPSADPQWFQALEARLAELGRDGGPLVGLERPGFAGIHPEATLPFTEFVARYELDGLPQLLAPFFVGYGYGYFDEVPAAHVLKYMNAAMRRACFATGEVFFVDGGFDRLWREVAEELDVRRGESVRTIVRNDDEVRVETDRGEHRFEVLILACAPDRLLDALDADAEEAGLFGELLRNEYWTVLADVDGLPERSAYLPEHLDRSGAGRLSVAVRRYRDLDSYLLYTMTDASPDAAAVAATLREDVEAQGARVRDVVASERWRVFPRVDAERMQQGWYDRVESLQGRRRTYYCGELLAFALVERVVEYSEHLVGRHFAAGR
jgi:predicted NAD/FAD-binding protein